MVAPGDWGAVFITKGRYRGKLGYYDDEGTPKTGVVYLDVPFIDDYVLIRYSSMTRVTSLKHEKFKKQNKELCKRFGVV